MFAVSGGDNIKGFVTENGLSVIINGLGYSYVTVSQKR